MYCMHDLEIPCLGNLSVKIGVIFVQPRYSDYGSCLMLGLRGSAGKSWVMTKRENLKDVIHRVTRVARGREVGKVDHSGLAKAR